MSANDNQHHDQDPLPLPEGARAALRQRGEALLGELSSMRLEAAEMEVAGRIALEPLDPQAALALRRRGDELLSRLAAQRIELESARAEGNRARRRWGWGRWGGVAAALAALAVAIHSAVPPASPPAAAPATTAAPTSPTPNGSPGQWPAGLPLSPPAIPEPNSALLTMLSAVAWLSRRRRPGSMN